VAKKWKALLMEVRPQLELGCGCSWDNGGGLCSPCQKMTEVRSFFFISTPPTSQGPDIWSPAAMEKLSCINRLSLLLGMRNPPIRKNWSRMYQRGYSISLYFGIYNKGTKTIRKDRKI
jgi:hypothetical protein